MAYEGFTLGEMIEFIASVCKKNDWDINRNTIAKFLNMANAEINSSSNFNLAYWEAVTEANINAYLLPSDMDTIDDVFIQETGEEGGVPLVRTTLKKIKATLADDVAENVVEP